MDLTGNPILRHSLATTKLLTVDKTAFKIRVVVVVLCDNALLAEAIKWLFIL